MSEPASAGPRFALGLLALALLAAFVRSLDHQLVLLGDTVAFPIADAQYHVRRALYAFHNFPATLLVDPYINYPDGAAVAWPPGWTWLLAALGQACPSEAAFERLLAWAPVVVGTATLLPVAAVARRLAGREAAWLAAGLLALLPVHATFSRIGNVDHHVAVSLLGACLLWVSVGFVERKETLLRQALLLAFFRTALLFTWHGSLLYVAVVDGGLVLAVVASGCRRSAVAQAAAALASAAVVALYVSLTPEPLLGAYSSIALSWLHVVALLGVAAVAGSLFAFEQWRPARSIATRLAVAVGAGVVFLALVFLFPGPREGILPALQFLSVSDAAGARTGEQFPLYDLFAREVGRPPWISWGLLAYAIPLVPLALLARTPRRPGRWLLVWWTAVFGALAIAQRRYGNDLAAPLCVALGLLGADALRLLAARVAWPRALRFAAIATLALLLLAPGIAATHWPRFSRALVLRSGELAGRDLAMLTVAGTLTRFAQALRRATPETRGFLDASQQPEYGVVSHANLGHAIQNVARRPTPTDPFWSYIGEQNWAAAFGLLGATSEADAMAHARALRARYVVSMPSATPGTLEARLHASDGRGDARQRGLAHFRHVIDAAPGGRGAGDLFQRRPGGARAVPYKLFEIVPGALLEITAPAGTPVRVSVQVATARGRSFEWSAQAESGPEGRVEIRVPYARGPASRTRAVQPYRVEIGSARHVLPIAEAQVRSGARVRCCGE